MDLQLLRRLVEVPGVSGHEERVASIILESVGGSLDDMGNVRAGNGKVLFVAHMDEIGLLVTHVDSEGKVRFRKVGGVPDQALPSQHVVVHGEGDVPGVIGVEPPHFSKSERQDLYIDVGASSPEEAAELGVVPFSPVTFLKVFREVGRYLSSRAMDDRAGCWVLVEAYRQVPNAAYAWTVQEEVGLVGARALARSVDVRAAIIVDTLACCNPSVTGGVRPGGGPVLRVFDNYGPYPRKLASRIAEIARRHDIPIQVGGGGGGTDAAAFQQAGVPSIAIGIPNRYAHSSVEMVHMDDLRNTLRLVVALASEL